MLVTWQTVLLENVQLHMTLLFAGSVFHPELPLHGSTLKFQSIFPRELLIFRSAATAKKIIKSRC